MMDRATDLSRTPSPSREDSLPDAGELTLEFFQACNVLALSENQLSRARLLVGLHHVVGEDVPSLASRLYAAQRPENWLPQPVPAVWTRTTLAYLARCQPDAFAALCAKYGFPQGSSSLRMMLRWAQIVMTLSGVFREVLRHTADILGLVQRPVPSQLHGVLTDLEEGGCWTAQQLLDEMSDGLFHDLFHRTLEQHRARWEHLELAAHAGSEKECDTKLSEWKRVQMAAVERVYNITAGGDEEEEGNQGIEVEQRERSKQAQQHIEKKRKKKRPKLQEEHRDALPGDGAPTQPHTASPHEQKTSAHDDDEDVAGDQVERDSEERVTRIMSSLEHSGRKVQDFLELYWDEATSTLHLHLIIPDAECTVQQALAEVGRAEADEEGDSPGWLAQDLEMYDALHSWWALVSRAHSVRALLEDVASRQRSSSVKRAWKRFVQTNELGRRRYSYSQARKYAQLSRYIAQHPKYLYQVEYCTLKLWTEAPGLCKLLEAHGALGEVGRERWPRPEMPEPEELELAPAARGTPLGLCGLVNLGNTCYMNSVVQALMNCALLRHLMLQGARSSIEECQALLDRPEEVSLSNALCALTSVAWSGRCERLAPLGMQDAVWRQLADFRSLQQQDAHELVVALLNALPEEQVQLFRGRGFLVLECAACGFRQERHANPYFHQLMLPLTLEARAHHKRKVYPSCTMHECLQKYFAGELLTEYRCDQCDTIGRVTRTPELQELPQLLCVSFVRFCKEVAGKRAKNAAHVRFPLDHLVMGPLGSYRLCSVVVHEGHSMSNGHYRCYARNKEAQSWLVLDDEVVQRVGEEQVLAQQAYVLFYERK